MGLVDYNERLTPTAQAFTSTGGVATNAKPLGATGEDIARGEPMCIRFVLTAVSSASGTIQCQVVTATASDGTTGQVVLASTAAITDTSLAIGDEIIVPIPPALIPTLAPTATHITGKVVLASSGTCTALIDLLPLRLAAQSYKAYVGKPTTFA